jgi:hypothetical protein
VSRADGFTERKKVRETLCANGAKLAREVEKMHDLYDFTTRLFSAENLQTAMEETLDSTIRLLEY